MSVYIGIYGGEGIMDWTVGKGNRDAASRNTPESLGAGRMADLILSAPRPSVLLTEREISVLRRGLTKNGWKRDLYLHPAPQHPHVYAGEGVLSIAQRSLEREVIIPARSGHYHNFFCECGSRLTIPDEYKEQKDYACPACGKMYSGEAFDGAVRYLHHNALAGFALALALTYAIEKDKRYADKAGEILLKYAEAYPGPHTDPSTGGMMSQSLCEAVWVIPLAQAYDLIYYSRGLSDEQRSVVEEKLFRPAAEGLRNVGTNLNWGSWHLSGVGVIGCAIKDADMVLYAVESFGKQMTDQLGEDGIWPESIHCYHFYALSAFVHLAEACYRSGIDLYDWEVAPGKSLKAMFLAPLQYVYPSFRLPAIKDGWYDSFLPVNLYEIAIRRWNDPSFAWVLKTAVKLCANAKAEGDLEAAKKLSRRSFYAFLFGRDLPGRAGTPPLRSSNLTSIGIATLRSGADLMATMVHGPFLQHGHLDKLSFTLFANGRVLVPDYGTPGYGSKALGWYQGTAGHNTVIVDGRSQDASRDYGLVTHYGGSYLQWAEAVGKDIYPGVVHTRKFILLGGSCVVLDDLASDEPHDYDWFMRCDGRSAPLADLPEADMDLSMYPELECSNTFAAEGRLRADWSCGSGKLALGLWSRPGGSLVALGMGPADTAASQVSTIVCREHGSNASFASVLVPSTNAEVSVTRTGRVARVMADGAADHIYLRDSADGGPAGFLESDAEIAAVHTEDDQIRSIALINGSWISWKGERLIECPASVRCVEVSFAERNPIVRYCCRESGTVKIRTSARAMRINGYRTAATTVEGYAMLRVTPQMLRPELLGGTQQKPASDHAPTVAHP